MEGVITKLADVTYDFVGVLLPGAALVLLGAFQWHFYLATLHGPASWNGLTSLLLSKLVILEGHPWATALGGLGASYLAGRAVLFVARNGLAVWSSASPWVTQQLERLGLRRTSWPRSSRLAHRILLWRTPKDLLRDLDPVLKPSFELCCVDVPLPSGSEGTPTAWRAFQLVATRMLQQGEKKTRYQIHQYKYTLDRSLATVFSLGLWSSLALLAIQSSEWPFLLLEAVAFVFMAFVFDDEHAFHWGLWADVLVADSLAARVGTKK